MQRNLEALHSAPKPLSLDDSPIPVPKFIKKLSSTRNSRLAVDPRAMAASCSIHLAEMAYQSADWDTAFLTFQSIVENYPEPQYAFYVSEASKAIEEFSAVRPASLSSHDSLVHLLPAFFYNFTRISVELKQRHFRIPSAKQEVTLLSFLKLDEKFEKKLTRIRAIVSFWVCWVHRYRIGTCDGEQYRSKFQCCAHHSI